MDLVAYSMNMHDVKWAERLTPFADVTIKLKCLECSRTLDTMKVIISEDASYVTGLRVDDDKLGITVAPGLGTRAQRSRPHVSKKIHGQLHQAVTWICGCGHRVDANVLNLRPEFFRCVEQGIPLVR